MSLDQKRFCLVFFPADREERSKGQTQDDTVEIGVGGREWLRDVAKDLSETRRGAPTFFNISLPALQRFFAFGLERAGLNCLGYTPHCLRHGNASADAHMGSDATRISFRGQWRNVKSVAKYMKKEAYLRQLSRLSANIRRAATQAEASLRRRLAKEILKRAPRCREPSSPSDLRELFPSACHKIQKRRRAGAAVWAPKKG